MKIKILSSLTMMLSLTIPLFAIPYKLGIESMPKQLLDELKKKKIALISNQTGKDQQGKRTLDILRQHGLHIVKILAPEHGFDGKVPAGMLVKNSIDKKTKIPITSLYGEGCGKKIAGDLLQNIDVMIFDLQDSGMRHYTYISTLMSALEAAAMYKKEIIVLDRPNPLGNIMEGPLVEPSLKSFVSIASIPVRHGMTIGELAYYFNERVLTKRAALKIVWMAHYDRHDGIGGKLLAPLSPNLNSLQACYGYSFLGLLGEIEPFEVGIKVGDPFQAIMLPQSKSISSLWRQMSTILKGYGIDVCDTRCSSKKCRQQYCGLWLHFKTMNSIPAFQLLLEILDVAKESKIQLTFSALFDKAMGTKKVKAYMQGHVDRKSLIDAINKETKSFFAAAEPYFYYKPIPRLSLLR